jgi:hypothetical protein
MTQQVSALRKSAAFAVSSRLPPSAGHAQQRPRTAAGGTRARAQRAASAVCVSASSEPRRAQAAPRDAQLRAHAWAEAPVASTAKRNACCRDDEGQGSSYDSVLDIVDAFEQQGAAYAPAPAARCMTPVEAALGGRVGGAAPAHDAGAALHADAVGAAVGQPHVRSEHQGARGATAPACSRVGDDVADALHALNGNVVDGLAPAGALAGGRMQSAASKAVTIHRRMAPRSSSASSAFSQRSTPAEASATSTAAPVGAVAVKPPSGVRHGQTRAEQVHSIAGDTRACTEDPGSTANCTTWHRPDLRGPPLASAAAAERQPVQWKERQQLGAYEPPGLPQTCPHPVAPLQRHALPLPEAAVALAAAPVQQQALPPPEPAAKVAEACVCVGHVQRQRLEAPAQTEQCARPTVVPAPPSELPPLHLRCAGDARVAARGVPTASAGVGQQWRGLRMSALGRLLWGRPGTEQTAVGQQPGLSGEEGKGGETLAGPRRAAAAGHAGSGTVGHAGRLEGQGDPRRAMRARRAADGGASLDDCF